MAAASREVSDRVAGSRPGVLAFLFKRAAASLISLVVFVVIVFFLIEALIPYDNPAVGPGVSVSERFMDYMLGLARGDLGQSYGGRCR